MTSIVIIGLGAVVILIIVVVLAAMHYLRADDGDDFDDLPDDRADGVAGRDRHVSLRRSGHEAHPPQWAAGGERRRAARDRVSMDNDQRFGRGYGDHPGRQRGPRDYPGERDYAAGRGGRPEAIGYEDRRAAGGGSQRRQDSLPAVRPRPARGKKADDGDWPSTDWDQLSDVDYWAQVASDKPLTTTAQPAGQARTARSGQDRAEARQAQGSRPGPAPQQVPVSRTPVRGQPQPAVAAPQAVTGSPELSPAQLAAASSQPEPGQWLPSPRPEPQPGRRRSEPSLAMLASFGGHPPAPGYADDDPLTSPSFPRIPADSRSYHNGHGGSAASPQSRGPAPGNQRPTAYPPQAGRFDGYGFPGQQNATAGGGGYGQPGAGSDSTSPQPYRPATSAATPVTGSYPGHGGQASAAQTVPPESADSYPGGQFPAARAMLPAPPGPGPAGNPYGSYVTSATRSGPADSSPALPGSGGPARYDGYPAGPGTGQRDVSYPPLPQGGQAPAAAAGSGSGWYPAGSAGGQAGLPSQSAPPGGHEAGYQNGSAHAGLTGYPDGQQPAGYLPAGYPGPHPYQGAGYAGPDSYGPDPYGGYPGYGTDR